MPFRLEWRYNAGLDFLPYASETQIIATTIELSNGNYVVTGPAGSGKTSVIMLDSEGGLVWQKDLQDVKLVKHVIETKDHNILFGGYKFEGYYSGSKYIQLFHGRVTTQIWIMLKYSCLYPPATRKAL